MINPSDFFNALIEQEIDFFTGVPDSLLRDFCSVLSSKASRNNHVTAPNEGAAISIAIGNYAATGKVPLVYMQNSGIGNAINPLVSLADPQVMATPIMLLIGWRGEITENGQQIKDEPQHVKQGQITPELLNVLDIPYEIIDGNSKFEATIAALKSLAFDRNGPTAIISRRGTFEPANVSVDKKSQVYLSRENALKKIVEIINPEAAIISTTGMLSRELFELRAKTGQPQRDLFTVGGMGHAVSIAIGVACAKPDKQIICLDGDGSALMHMGALSIGAQMANLTHIVFNNKSHDSVGGQNTCAPDIYLSEVAKSLGYDNNQVTSSIEGIESEVRAIHNQKGSTFIEIMCSRGSRLDLGRPIKSPQENFNSFRSFLRRGHHNEQT